MYPRTRYGVAPVLAMARHPSNSNSIIVVDLAEDIEMLLQASADELATNLFTAGNVDRPPLKEIRINRCPFVAPIDVLNEENTDRLGIDLGLVHERARRLKQPGVREKIARVYNRPRAQAATDPDAALYDGFLHDSDRSRCRQLHEELVQGRWQDLDYQDPRLGVLAQRMKARSFNGLLDDGDLAQWREFVVAKLEGEGDWRNLKQYEAKVTELLGDQNVPAEKYELLTQLAEHSADIRQRYQL
jgi:exodeoxyribonuclease-1